jgi:myo-inositol-1(or 4)-monophosphatase
MALPPTASLEATLQQHLSPAVRKRVLLGTQALLSQVGFLKDNLGIAPSHRKHDNTRVTDADVAISRALLGQLQSQFPQDHCLSEETHADYCLDLNSEFAWILDPIDGTDNYAIGLPACAISLGLLHEGVPIYGWVYDLARDRLVQGGQGVGVWDADTLVPPRSSLAQHHSSSADWTVAIHGPLPTEAMPHLSPILHSSHLRSLGSAALHLAYMALGKWDGYIDFKLKVWDIAAGYCLIRANQMPFHFITESVFPLRRFQVNHSPLGLYTGTPEFCATLKNMRLPLKLSSNETEPIPLAMTAEPAGKHA